MKESESKNENIAAVVDNFPKLRTTSRVSIDDCHWLSDRKKNEAAFQWHHIFPGQVLVTETKIGSDNLYQIGPRYSGWQGLWHTSVQAAIAARRVLRVNTNVYGRTLFGVSNFQKKSIT